MDGSRMQYELEKIILEKYGNDPEKMKPFSKYFYREEIFNDSTPGCSKPIYRQQHLHVDNHRTTDDNMNHESAKKGVYHQQRKDDSNVNLRSPGVENKQSSVQPGISIFGYGDPLDVLFGYSSTNEEPHHLPDESGNSAKVQSRSQKRAHRRHRLRHRNQETLALGG
ncbi:uncharacterized protein LOC110739927 isoform X1 [Chenopodium quinoa]|uniref:uncharacterized protein LOC110739927 isoform X1 n=1 Tax=Chenopodium quinoa TaxID=63459 RepID=UPI000B77A044|nr:uncharacterized protein LOC110739927 isoform X1 [Chenopodium quinoa]